MGSPSPRVVDDKEKEKAIEEDPGEGGGGCE